MRSRGWHGGRCPHRPPPVSPRYLRVGTAELGAEREPSADSQRAESSCGEQPMASPVCGCPLYGDGGGGRHTGVSLPGSSQARGRRGRTM